MRRLLTVGASLLTLCASAPAVAHDAGTRHDATHARAAAVERCGSERPAGRDIVRDGVAERRTRLAHEHGIVTVTEEQPATRAQVRRYAVRLAALCPPEPVARTATAQTGAPSGGLTGSCPAVIPSYIIQAESGGNPNAQNPSGAYGCYQIMPEHWNGGACSDLGRDIGGQAECASRLWDGGNGASNWDETR